MPYRSGLGLAAAGVLAALSSAANAATLYVSLNASNEVASFTNAGAGGAFTGTETNNFITGVTAPYGVAVDPSGNVYVLPNASAVSAVSEYSSAGGSTPLASSSTFGYNNDELIQYGSNQLFASSFEQIGQTSGQNGSVYQLTETPGSPPTISVGSNYLTGAANASTAPEQSAIGTFNGTTYLYVANYETGGVVALNLANLAGGVAYSVTVTGATHCAGLAVDANGNIFVDNLANKLFEITGSGSNPFGGGSTQVPFAGGSVTLAAGNGMAFGPDGNLYITDITNKNIDEINTGTGSGTSDELNSYITGLPSGPYALTFTPEPGSASLFALGAIGLLARRRRNPPIVQ